MWRQCDLKFRGFYMREEVVEWREGESYTVHIYDSALPMENIFTTIGVVPVDGARCVAYMQTRYEPKWEIAGAVLDALVWRWMLYFMFKRVLKGLDQHLARQVQ